MSYRFYADISASTRPPPGSVRTALSSSATPTASTALRPVGRVEPSPAFLHAGFRAADPVAGRALMERMDADGVTTVERNDEPAYVAFKCLDPDGHRAEVAWEPQAAR